MKTVLAIILFALAVSVRAEVATDRDWSIAVVGDMHFGTEAQISDTNKFIPWIMANRSGGSNNVKVFVSPGDCFEQHTNFGTYVSAAAFAMRDALRQIAASNVLVIPAQGNHDANGPGGWAGTANNNGNGINPDLSPWQDVYGTPIWNQVGSVGTRLENDYSNWAVAFTNTTDGSKFLFLTYQVMNSCNSDSEIPAQFDAQTMWITNMALTHMDHNVVLIGHYIINANGVITGKDATGYTGWNGPSVAVLDSRILALPNIFMTISGHDRRMFKVHKYLSANDGHIVDIAGMNSQGHTNNPGFIYLIKFRSGTKTVEHSTFDTVNSRWVEDNDTNLHFYAEASGYSYTNRWTNSLVIRPAYNRAQYSSVLTPFFRGRR